MKVKIQNQISNQSKEKYYSKIRNLLEKIDNDIKNTKNIEEEEENKHELNDILNMEKRESKPIEKCHICKIECHKYVCPKCKIKYCSVKCFKEHNEECTENFYKKCVEEELKNTKISQDDKKNFKKNIKNIFNKQTKEDEIFDEQEMDKIREKKRAHLENILEKIDNNSLDFVKDLTKEDFDDFQKFINGISNDYFNVNNKQGYRSFKIWKPYWESKLNDGCSPNLIAYDANILKDIDDESKITLKNFEINEYIEYFEEEEPNESFKNKNETNFSESIPNLEGLNLSPEDFEQIENYSNLFNYNSEYSNDNIKWIKINNQKVKINRDIVYKSIISKYSTLPNITSLTKISPNKNNILILANIILNSIYVFRLYNGGLNDLDNILEIAGFILQNMKFLYEKEIVVEDLSEILNKFKGYLLTYENKYCESIMSMTIKDFIIVLENKFFILETLLRIYEIIHKFLSEFSNDFDKYNDDNNKVNTKKHKKLINNFLLSKHKILYYLSFSKTLDYSHFEELIQKARVYMKEEKNISFTGNLIRENINRINK